MLMSKEASKNITKLSSQQLNDYGWALLPLSRSNKAPVHAYRDQAVKDITDEALLLEKLGGRTGLRLIGHIAIDIDSSTTHKGIDDAKGLELAKWLKTNGWFDPSKDMWQKTAGGGYHIIYKLPRKVIRNEHVLNKPLIKGVDIKSGGTSFVVNHNGFNRGVARELPIGLLSWLRRHMYIVREMPKIITSARPSEIVTESEEDVIAIAQSVVMRAQSGERNQVFSKMVWKLGYHDEVDFDTIRQALIPIGSQIGLDMEEMEASINHAERKVLT